MQVKIILGDDGTAMFAVDNTQGLSFEEAVARMAGLRQLLGDLPISFTGEPERHVHPHEHEHAHEHVHA